MCGIVIKGFLPPNKLEHLSMVRLSTGEKYLQLKEHPKGIPLG
jgi:hypothetical protein